MAQTQKVRRIPVIEIFGPTVQGEGLQTGHITHFLRTGGCGYNCTWCDSMHAVDPVQVKANRTMMSNEEICHVIETLPKAPWITLTGGDPCLHDFTDIINWCHGPKPNMAVCVETQGEIWPEWLRICDLVTLSPKGPTSGNVTDITTFCMELSRVWSYLGRVCIKPVVFNNDDLYYALELYRTLNSLPISAPYTAFHFQVGSPLTADIAAGSYHEREEWKRDIILERYQWLVEQLMSHAHLFDHRVAITPQLHTLLWPLQDRGR